MRNFRRNVGAEWKDFKLDKDEAKKIQQVTILKSLETLSLIDEIATAKKLTLKPEERLAIFEKTAPTYDQLAVDYCLQQLDAQRAASAAKPAAAAVNA